MDKYKRYIYIFYLIIGLIGISAGFVSLKYSFFLFSAFIFILIILSKPSVLIYPIVLYAFTDYIFRNVIKLSIFASLWDELVFVLIVVVWLIKCLWERNLKLNISKLDLYILTLIGVCLFLLIIKSPDIKIAIEGFRVVVEYALWFFVGVNILTHTEQFKRIINLFIFMIFLISAYGVYQYIIGAPMPSNWIDSSNETYIRTRVYSIIGSPNVLGSLIAMSIPIGFALAFNEKRIAKKIYYWISNMTMIICLAFTFSRGAWLAFVFSMLIYGILKERKVLYMLILIIFTLPIVAPSIVQRMLYMLSPTYVESSSRGGRIARWSIAIQVFFENIMFGVGFGRFGGAVAKRNFDDAFYVDNFYLKSACEMGLIGALMLIISFGAAIIFSIRVLKNINNNYLKNIGMGIVIGLITVLIHNSVENIFEVPMMSTYFWLFTGLIISLNYLSNKNKILEE